MKSVLYFTDILALVIEFQKFKDYRLVNIYDVEDHLYLIKLKNNDRKLIYLYVKPGCYIYKTEYPTDKRRKIPSSFCTRLRKYLNNKRITNVSTYQQDRIIRFYFGENEYQKCLVIELFGEGNIFLVNNDNKLIDFIYSHKYDDIRIKRGECHPYWNIENPNFVNDYNKLSNINPDQLINYGKDIVDEYNFRKSETITSQRLIYDIIQDIITSKSSYICDKYCIPFKYKFLQTGKFVEFCEFSNALDSFLQSKVKTTISKSSKKDKSSKSSIEYKRNVIITANKVKQSKLGTTINNYQLDIDKMIEHQPSLISVLKNTPIKDGKGESHEYLIENLDLKVLLGLNFYQNVNYVYEKIKNLNIKIEKTEKGLKTALDNFDRLNTIKTNKVATKVKVQIETSKWYQKYHYCYTKNNLLVICGKNADQNEEIVKKRMNDSDIYFHSDTPGCGSCIVVNPQKVDLTPNDLELVGTFTICMSNSWTIQTTDKSFWVYGSQVSKTPPTGEYISKGSFIITGKRNYLSLSQLELGLYIYNNELIITPYKHTIEYTKTRIKIIPAKTKQKRKLNINRVLSKLNLDSKYYDYVDMIIPNNSKMVLKQ